MPPRGRKKRPFCVFTPTYYCGNGTLVISAFMAGLLHHSIAFETVRLMLLDQPSNRESYWLFNLPSTHNVHFWLHALDCFGVLFLLERQRGRSASRSTVPENPYYINEAESYAELMQVPLAKTTS